MSQNEVSPEDFKPKTVSLPEKKTKNSHILIKNSKKIT